MRRFYLLWFFAVTLSATLAAGIQSTWEHFRLSDEADTHASALLSMVEDPVTSAYHAKRFSQIAKTMHRLQARPSEAIAGLAICSEDPRESPRAFPNGSGWQSVCLSPHVHDAFSQARDFHWDVASTRESLRFTARPSVDPNTSVTRVLVLIQDISFLQSHWLRGFLRNLAIYWLTGMLLLTLLATQLRRWIESNVRIARQTLRSLIAGRRPKPLGLASPEIAPALKPIDRDLDALASKIRLLSDAQARKGQEQSWLSELRKNLEHRELIVVANREPYIHQRLDNEIQVMRPASGLVTALEPVLRQCGGLWVAHGSGSADREMSDEAGIVEVPPGSPRYKLKRVWLTPEEEQGYYYGFANEGLWPLCHLAHTRPTFRLSDWEHYLRVNQKFCDAISLDKFQPHSVMLIQDYHFALMPQLIRMRARSQGAACPNIGIFWHIPWPNPEAFGICPWSETLLRGMLGADVVAFHTQYHCNNFLETCNRFLEARVDNERFSVIMENHETRVRAVPIGIDTAPVKTLSDEQVLELRKKYGIVAEKVAVGVDRLDYTKGLIERMDSVERFLEKNPQWVGRFTLAQMGSPSRTQIPAYQELSRKLDEAVARINHRFRDPSRPEYQPIVLLSSHHEWSEIQYFYQIGDVCLVTSLHDGMNLVAKEYVWCQKAERGSLVLSKFAGASRELTEAFIVNPYSIEEMADALASALNLSPAERELRMRLMKEKVQNRSAFHWASELIESVIEKDESVPVQPEEPGRKDMLKLAGVF